MQRSSCDVAICGGGLAGLTLALQLRRELPERSVVVVERLERPLPEAAFKVGEGTVEVGAFYLADILGLEEYLDRHHLSKRGLRFFFGDGTAPIEDRPELGLAGEPPVKSYLIDRGRLENDLRERVVEAGVDLREGSRVREVDLGRKGSFHEIFYEDGQGDSRRLRARWAVDATGRRRLLQRELELEGDDSARCSAAWFRVEGSLSVRDLVPPIAEEWHRRVRAENRDLPVTHLVDRGYWVWIIPLSSDATSVGIVTDEAFHDFADFNTRSRALRWLHAHEPILARDVERRRWLDFRVMRRYSYTADRVFSEDRWACVGEAAVFSDPLNAPGVDLIGFGNCMLVDMIRREAAGDLDPLDVRRYDAFLRGLNDLVTYQFQVGYGIFGHPVAATAKILWTVAAAWSVYTPQMFSQTFLDPEKTEAFRKATMGFFFLSRRMDALFEAWGRRSRGQARYELIDYDGIPFLKELSRRNLVPGKSAVDLGEDQRRNMEILEELAQALFLLAVEDQMPDRLERFEGPLWLNAWKVGLEPERWREDGLFEPRTRPRDLTPIREQIRELFVFDDVPAARG